MEKDLTWEEAILNVLRNHYPNAVTLQTIYSEVKQFKKLTEYHFEITKYSELRYHHHVRAYIENLVKKGKIERIVRGMYVLKE